MVYFNNVHQRHASKILKGMPLKRQYYKILTKLEEMLNSLKPCRHHGFGEKMKRERRLKTKKLSHYDV